MHIKIFFSTYWKKKKVSIPTSSGKQYPALPTPSLIPPGPSFGEAIALGSQHSLLANLISVGLVQVTTMSSVNWMET